MLFVLTQPSVRLSDAEQAQHHVESTTGIAIVIKSAHHGCPAVVMKVELGFQAALVIFVMHPGR